MMRSIVHIVGCDEKFAAGYINFQTMYLKEYRHVFITMDCVNKLNLAPEARVYYTRRQWDILTNKEIREEIRNCDKMIVTGVFGPVREVLFCEKTEILQKTYLQFWGGDFYCYRKKKDGNIKEKITGIWYQSVEKRIMKRVIKRCGGIINLIDTEWKEFYHLFPYNRKHFVAPMPNDPLKKIDYEAYRGKKEQKERIYRILIGNSADRANCHIDAFEKLKRFADEDIEIVVPLSYGDKDYRKEVIEKGTEIFGEKFRPVTHFMDIEKYTQFLNSCDAAVFNNNRQQAMGNINMLLQLGKKVFLRKDNRMWDHYKEAGLLLYEIDTADELSIREFVHMDPAAAFNNIKIMEKKQDFRRVIEQWKTVLEDNKAI